MPGKRTSDFGERLTQIIEEENLDYKVFYDHGDKELANVGKIYGHVGNNPSRKSNLAEVDVMVVNENDKVVLIIEIEEEASLGPKKILGVLMAILLSETFSFKGKAYRPASDTVFINSGHSNPEGNNAFKIREVIAPRIKQLSEQSPQVVIKQVVHVLEATLPEVIEETERQSRLALS